MTRFWILHVFFFFFFFGDVRNKASFDISEPWEMNIIQSTVSSVSQVTYSLLVLCFLLCLLSTICWNPCHEHQWCVLLVGKLKQNYEWNNVTLWFYWWIKECRIIFSLPLAMFNDSVHQTVHLSVYPLCFYVWLITLRSLEKFHHN